MGTEGNGSTPRRFDHGIVRPLEGVEDSLLWSTEEGRMFISECLDRYIVADWGEVPPWFDTINQRFASNAGIASGGVVVGIYEVPKVLQQSPGEDRLIVITTTLQPVPLIPELRVVTTLLLFVTDL